MERDGRDRTDAILGVSTSKVRPDLSVGDLGMSDASSIIDQDGGGFTGDEAVCA